MKSNKWKGCEHKWVSFDETKTYKKFKERNENRQESSEEKSYIEMKLHNQVDINHSKTVRTIKFFVKSILGKFIRNRKWKLEVWLDENKDHHNTSIICGVALKRPKKDTIYVRKQAPSVKEALKQTLRTIEKSVRRDGHQWNRHNLNLQLS